MKQSYKVFFFSMLFITLALSSLVPAQTSIVASDDSYVQAGASAALNFNTVPATPGDALRVRSSGTIDNIRMSYIKFNLSSVTGSITKAELSIWLDRAVNSSTNPVLIDRADIFTAKSDSWTEGALTYATAPARAKFVASQTFRRRATADPDTMYVWDVTSFVKTEFAGDKLITFVLADTLTPVNNTDLRIFSKESATAGNEPRLKVFTSGTAVEGEESLPNEFLLSQNYPNPFNPSTTIKYSLPKNGFAEVSVYNLLGQKVSTLFSGEESAGQHQLIWNGRNQFGSDVSSGIYFTKVSFAGQTKTIKMILNR